TTISCDPCSRALLGTSVVAVGPHVSARRESSDGESNRSCSRGEFLRPFEPVAHPSAEAPVTRRYARLARHISPCCRAAFTHPDKPRRRFRSSLYNGGGADRRDHSLFAVQPVCDL